MQGLRDLRRERMVEGGTGGGGMLGWNERRKIMKIACMAFVWGR